MSGVSYYKHGTSQLGKEAIIFLDETLVTESTD